MISKFFSSNSSSGGIPPGTYTPGSVLFAAADGSITQDNPRFFYDETNRRLGLGINSSLQARLHIRGTGNTNATNSFFVENSSASEAFRIRDDRTWIVGGGSAVANTNYTFNAFGSTTTSDYTLQVVGTAGDNTIRLYNSNGSTVGGFVIRRDALTARIALTIRGLSTNSLFVSSGGGVHYQPIQTLSQMNTNAADMGALFAQGSADATYPGIVYHASGNTQYGHHFLGQNRTWMATGFPFFSIKPDFSATDNTASNITSTIVKIYPTYNLQGTTTFNVIGLDYNPTVTNLTGTHYGFVFRTANSLNGIGLGSSLPTALLHLAGSTTARASFRIESGTLPTGANHKDGDFTYDGTDINFRQSSTTKLIEFQPIQQTVNATTANTNINFNSGNVVILNLQVATTALTLSNLRVGTYIIIVKQDATGGRLMTYGTTMNFAGGVAPVLTAAANASDIFTIVYDGTNIRTAVSQNYAI